MIAQKIPLAIEAVSGRHTAMIRRFQHPFLPHATVLGMVLAALTTGCHKRERPSLPEPVVQVTEAKSETVPVIRSFVGTVDGYQNTNIQARVVGYLMEQVYTEGSLVQKGDVLFKIDPRPFIAALRQAEADLAQASAKAQLAETTLARQTQLFETNVISAQEFDVSTQEARADIAAVKAAAAAVENAQLNLEFCTVTAPFTGIAGIAEAQVGDLVGTTNNTVLTQMSEVSRVKVYFPISEQQYLNAAPHLLQVVKVPFDKRPANITLQLANGSTYPEKGTFEFANREVGVTTGTILISAVFPNPDLILRPGQYAKVFIKVKEIENAVVIPQRAVQQIQTNFQAAVVASNGEVTVRPIEVGQKTEDGGWVITSGIEAGENVIVEGLQHVKTGMKVKTAPYQAASAEATPTPTPQATPAPTPAS